MEKYSQYRDRGSGIAPFFPIPSEASAIQLPLHILLFIIRLPLLLTVVLTYFILLQWLPIGSLGKKAVLWLMLGVPGVWWIDLQIDGVKKGSLAKHHQSRLPQPSSIIASSFTSPIDCLYLGAIFDPIFTVSYPSTRLIHRISLGQAILRALSGPKYSPSTHANLTDLQTLLREHPKRIVVVFPECTTTNGRGILSFSPSLLTTPPTTKIFPISLRYSPGDITTPIPGAYFTFLWNLLSQPTHCIRVRIAENVYNTSKTLPGAQKSSYYTNYFDASQDDTASSTDTLLGSDDSEGINLPELRVLYKVAEALARLGRVKRVGLGAKEKSGFVEAWTRQQRR